MNPMLIIADDNDRKATFDHIKDYQINVVEDTLYFIINAGDTTFEYEIKTDSRAKDLNSIKDFLNKHVNAAINGRNTLCISEYLVRQYIYVGNDDDRRQFTATRK